jgi:hypothetical protein
VIGRDNDRIGLVDCLVEALSRRCDVRVVDGDVGQFALEQTDQLVRE